MTFNRENWDHARWPNFAPSEFVCRETASLAMDGPFLDKLQALRTKLGFPLVISSGYRSTSHSIEKAKASPGVHCTGKAADIAVCSRDADRLIRTAIELGFVGIGIKQHGDYSKRYVHLDTVPDGNGFARPMIWTYV